MALNLRDTCTIVGKGPGPFAGKRLLYDPACFVDDDDLYGPTRDAAERDALPTGPGFDEPFSVDAFLANLKDPAAEEEQQEQNKRSERGMGAAAAAAAAAPSKAASSRATSSRTAKKGKIIPQASWDEQDRREAMELLQKNTAPNKSDAGCVLWQAKQGQRTYVSFRKVTYPSWQAFAFAVHHPDLPLQQDLTAEAKCGNRYCITPGCLRLVYNYWSGAKGDNFPELGPFEIIGLQRDAETDERIAMQYEKSCHTVVFDLYDAKKYAEIHRFLKPPA
jgi:hypothetical protein